ncbi:hypothetical protein KIKIMORA_04340 [Brevundimonas phage vB_BpoS-Kikimora]|uniref:Uncharacterized protein n=1 Tax=Brevundimonas phage vB_BpoS-Kikimora TaxID=2948601 RepID=A0A9E7SMW3_9CAUD|nr:hypothetical protein KIKIMORA_04340 [Brevundimonas phage vB_BpoS-Kikimora]
MFRNIDERHKTDRINPASETKRATLSGAMNSRTYIAAFAKADVNPIEVVDEETRQARERQIVAICRRLCPTQTNKVKDPQVLGLHRNFMSGRL